MSRKKVIAANWKMYKTPVQAQEFVQAFLPLVANHDRDEIVLCPSDTSLSVVIAAVSGFECGGGRSEYVLRRRGRIYRRDLHRSMLKAINATHVILRPFRTARVFRPRLMKRSTKSCLRL